jgi:hypothetical protein
MFKVVFYTQEGLDDWDQVAVVRYRSRRDMFKMAGEIAALGIDEHKWASIEKTQVFPIKPFFDISFLRLMVAGLFLLLALMINGLIHLSKRRANNSS